MSHEFRSIYLPYCLQKQEDGRFIVLNRNYKPIGFNSLDHFDYNAYPISGKIKELNASAIKKLAWNGILDKGFIFLYNDALIPTRSKENMDQYLERLKILASYQVEM